MTVLVRQKSDLTVSISPEGFEDPMGGQLWIPGYDDGILTEGWEEVIGCAGVNAAVYDLRTPAMVLYDDPFCPVCKNRDYHCRCFAWVMPELGY